MKITPIPYTRPSITQLEIDMVTDAVTHGWGEHCYDYIETFASEFSAFLEVQYALPTSSCTGALHLGLTALGIGPGDEVIIADSNWIASVAPICHLGATPVFVDILPESWCIDPIKVRAAITSRTKAIMAVHLYGNLCEIDALQSIADQFGLILIEDAAEALGSIWKGQYAGTMGQFGAFSFHGTKTMTTGEGGMFVTNDEQLYETALTLSNHGRRRGQNKQFWADMIGFKYKMSNIDAALGTAQIRRVQELTSRKRDILAAYRQILSDLPQLSLNPEPVDGKNGAWMPTAVFTEASAIRRERIIDQFSAQSIDARGFFYPLSALPMFNSVTGNINAWSIAERAVNMPSFHDMLPEEIERVATVIQSLCEDTNGER